MAGEQQSAEQWFEGLWTHREDTLYRGWVGDMGKGIYTIPQGVFEGLGCKAPDPRFTCTGVFECPPEGGRGYWAYITSGLSNPWGMREDAVEPGGYSALGMEFVLLTPGAAPWAIRVLQSLAAIQHLVAAGQLQGELLEMFDRIPLGAAVEGESLVRNMVLVEPPAPFPGVFELASGKVELMLCVGVTDREMDFAKTQGCEALLGLLRHKGFWPVTDAGRMSAV